MRRRVFASSIVALAIVALGTVAWGQVTEIGGVGNIFQKRQSSSPTPRAGRASATPANKATPTPAGNAQQQQKAKEATPGKQGQPPAGNASPQNAPRTVQNAPPAGKPANRGNASSNAPAGTGQLQLVTKGLVDSIKTRIVDYDEDALRTSGTAIIVSPRRYKPE